MKKLTLIAASLFLAVAANAQLNYTVQTACHPKDVKGYDTERLREAFLMEKVMSPDEINLTYTFKWIGVSILVIYTCVLVFLNRRAIIKYQNESVTEKTNE